MEIGNQHVDVLQAFLNLTKKQHEVMRYVAESWTSKEIAREIGISESAVNQRIETIRGYLGAPSRSQLSRAYRQFLLKTDDMQNDILAMR